MAVDPVAQLMAFASAHHGLFRSTDAAALGVGRRRLQHLVALGACAKLARGVYVVRGAPRTSDQAIHAAALANAGSAASHRAAASLLGIRGYRAQRPEVLVLHAKNRLTPLGTIHGTLILPPDHLTTVRGIPTTTAPRTVFDLAGVEPRGRAERALDAALKQRLCTVRDLGMVLFLLGKRGRPGTAAMRTLLAERGLGYVAPATELERVGRRLFRLAGLPEPAFEVWVGTVSDRVGRVDCLWRDAKLIVELDGGAYHDDQASRTSDRVRDNALMAQGWRVLRFTWWDLTKRGEWVVALIRQALARTA